MKLLFCPKCKDLFKLDYETRSCKCGEVVGRYEKDGLHAVVNGKGISVAIEWSNFLVALRLYQRGSVSTPTFEGRIREHEGIYNPNTRTEELKK